MTDKPLYICLIDFESADALDLPVEVCILVACAIIEKNGEVSKWHIEEEYHNAIIQSEESMARPECKYIEEYITGLSSKTVQTNGVPLKSVLTYIKRLQLMYKNIFWFARDPKLENSILMRHGSTVVVSEILYLMKDDVFNMLYHKKTRDAGIHHWCKHNRKCELHKHHFNHCAKQDCYEMYLWLLIYGRDTKESISAKWREITKKPDT